MGKAVDFELARMPAVRVAVLSRRGPWKEDILRSEFRTLTQWASANGLRTGRWIFLWGRGNQSTAALEVLGRARSRDGIRVRTLPAARVGRVRFDPEVVSPRVIYHGLADWLMWQRKEKRIRRVLSNREVYEGDPWSRRDAWARTEVQFLVR
jgi:hypothetical protein